MPTEIIRKNRQVKQDVIYISILLIIALCIGVYLIVTTTVIAKDGVTFIRYADSFEKAPAKTMLQQYQHPGYPVMILAARRFVELASQKLSLLEVIYSAQAVSLLLRLLSIVVLYFIGKGLVGAKNSFLAVLILTFLPRPAEYGSDVLSDWPHLFFLAAGLLLLIRGAKNASWRLFGIAGLFGGIGYLVRPECAQVVVYGLLWLGLQLFWSKRIMQRPKAALALVVLIGGFAITAGPYMNLKGAIFPKKGVGNFSFGIRSGQTYQPAVISSSAELAGSVPSDAARAAGKLTENVGVSLVWFFLLPLLIGIYKHLQEGNPLKPEKFFIIALVVTNVPVMIWLCSKYGYMSSRHTLPIVIFTIFYIPSGIQAIAKLLAEKFFKGQHGIGHVTVILIAAGIVICSFRLFRPMHPDKLIYRQAAQWLSENTAKDVIVGVPDIRISFYAGREGLEYDGTIIPDKARYIVATPETEKNNPAGIVLVRLEDKYNERRLVIFEKSP
jgi:hypothetical protein